jgi:hypothetical protein
MTKDQKNQVKRGKNIIKPLLLQHSGTNAEKIKMSELDDKILNHVEDFFTANSFAFLRCFNHGFKTEEQCEQVIKAIQAKRLTWDWVLSHSVSDTMMLLDLVSA